MHDLETLRHSCAHIMADAVQRLYPGTKLGIGPSIKDGFYYDFDSDVTIVEEDLPKIIDEMKKIIKANVPFVRENIPREQAEKLFSEKNEIYKLKLIEELNLSEVSVYRHGDFVDLCRGPHVDATGDIKAFTLLGLAGAYWHGLETNPMLQRIYGTSFQTQKDLDAYLTLQEECKKRDHRKLAKELELFSFHQEIGAGLVLYHPNGALLRHLIEEYIKKEHLKRGYHMVVGPQIMRSDIWKKSGHYDYYRDNMYFFEVEKNEFAIKPMNCPGHIMVYGSTNRSYRDLPLRLFELGTVHRHEKAGVLHGLLRVRGFTQDDAHIFCLPEQVESEIIKVIDFVIETLRVFGFNDHAVELSTRPDKYIGNDDDWQRATDALKNALDAKKIVYDVNEGEGAFYGPKIDMKLKDALGREWQCATIQCDFALPERFDLTYTDSDGSKKRPIMLHRVILGSLERFLGAVIEHYGGAFPVWLAPGQAVIIPITDKQQDYCLSLAEQLRGHDIRVEVDARAEKMQKKIRDAETKKIPYMLVVGGREVEAGQVAVRSKSLGSLGTMSVDDFVKRVQHEVAEKKDIAAEPQT